MIDLESKLTSRHYLVLDQMYGAITSGLCMNLVFTFSASTGATSAKNLSGNIFVN